MPANPLTTAASFAALLSLAAAAGLPSCAQVQTTTVGTIKAQIGDQPYAGEFLAIPSEGATTAGFRPYGPVTGVTLQAHDPKSDSRMNNVFTLEFSVMGDGAAATVATATATYWPNGMDGAFYTSDEGGGETVINLESLGFDAETSVTGSFTSTICRKNNFMTEIDLDTCLPVEGRFETAIEQAN